MVKIIFLKSIHIHSLNLLNFICAVLLDAETGLQSAKLATLKQLQWQIFPPTNHGEVRLKHVSQESFPVFYKNQNVTYAKMLSINIV